MGALLPGNLLSHRKLEVKLSNNARNLLSPTGNSIFFSLRPQELRKIKAPWIDMLLLTYQPQLFISRLFTKFINLSLLLD